MKYRFVNVLVVVFLFVFLVGVVSAEIVSINPVSVYEGDTITLTIKPAKAGFYNIINIHDVDNNVVDVIVVDCGATICTKRNIINYIVPAGFLGQYYFAIFDYAIDDYELEYFGVLEQVDPGDPPPGQGSLEIVYIQNEVGGTNTLVNPEQGQNARISISVLLNIESCESYFVDGYICDSSVGVCDDQTYTYQIPLVLSSQAGRKCYWEYVGEDYFPFYQQPDNWKLYIKSGHLTDLLDFMYTPLMAIDYVTVIDFGTLNLQMWNVGVPETDEQLINHGNVEMMVEWTSSGFSCVSPGCKDFWSTFYNDENTFQIDDDNLFMEETETLLEPVFITDFTDDYFPQNPLAVCISDLCDGDIGESTMTYFNLKIPSIERGVYQGDIVISLY